MLKTLNQDLPVDKRISTSGEGLAQMLGCGKATAVKIGTDAGARFQIGRRVLFNVQKVREYLDKASGQ